MISGTLVVLAALVGAAPSALPVRLPPIDQCAAVPGFADFRRNLAQAIAKRDRAALLAMISDDILAALGQGGEGKREFIEAWALEKPEPSALWKKLDKALALGCAQSGDALVSPSMIAQIGPEVDAINTLIAVEPGTRLYSEGSESSAVVAVLQWDVLTLRDEPIVEPFVPVTMADGRRGYVAYDQLRSPADYRAVFEQRYGRWLMTAFVAGD